jgi:hypothetical protein
MDDNLNEKNGGCVVTHHHDTAPAKEGAQTDFSAMAAHVEKYIGPIDATITNAVPYGNVNVDIWVINPTPERDFYTLISVGMSALPMNAPDQEGLFFSELMVCLPADWKMDEDAWDDPFYHWPIQELFFVAKIPHDYDTLLWQGHTIPNGQDHEPFAPGTNMCGWFIDFPRLVPDEFILFKESAEKTVMFFGLYPLYEKEMAYTLEEGADALSELFYENDVTEYLDPSRPDVTDSLH